LTENGNLMFRPTGSVIQLMDGRIFKRNQRNLWEDINTGVTITEQQLNLMVSSASFSADASGGGRTNRPVRFVPDYTVTPQQEWEDIIASNDNVEVQNTNKQILGINAPIEIRLQFNNLGTYAANSSLKVYKNNTLIDTISTNTRPTKTGDGEGFYTLSQTFSNGNNLKFGVISDIELTYQVTVLNKITSETISQSNFSVTVTGFG
jgi:hypothetical protein